MPQYKAVDQEATSELSSVEWVRRIDFGIDGVGDGELLAPESIVAELFKVGLDDADVCQGMDSVLMWEVLKETSLSPRVRALLIGNKDILDEVCGDHLTVPKNSQLPVEEAPMIWGRAVMISSMFTLLPVLSITVADSVLDETSDHMTQLTRAFILGIAVFACLLALSSPLSMFFFIDVLEERSFGTNHKDCMVDQMTNVGVIAALVGGMVGGALMGPPGPDGSFLNHSFIILSVASLYFSINAVGVSVMCLTYLQPIDDSAAEKFLAYAARFFGECLTGMCYSLVLFLDAICLWVWAAVSPALGAFTALVVWLLLVRFIVTMQWLGTWKNSEIPEAERKRRINRA